LIVKDIERLPLSSGLSALCAPSRKAVPFAFKLAHSLANAIVAAMASSDVATLASALSSAMICLKHSIPQSVKAGDAILTDAVDAQAAVFGGHVDLEFVQPILVLAEHLGDIGDSKDSCNGSQGQAA
jgi:hypothetical protein